MLDKIGYTKPKQPMNAPKKQLKIVRKSIFIYKKNNVGMFGDFPTDPTTVTATTVVTTGTSAII